MSCTKIRHLALHVLLPVLFVCSASAQDLMPGTARVTTQTHDAFSAGQTISVEAESDTELNDRLATAIQQDLRSRRIKLGGGGLTLRFATNMPEYGLPPRQRNVEIEGQGGSRGRSTVTGVLKVPLGQNKQPPEQAAAQNPHLQLRFDLLSPDGTPLWTGEIAAARGNADRYAVLTRLVPIVLDRLGKTTTDENVPFE